MDTAEQKIERRGSIESEFAGKTAKIEEVAKKAKDRAETKRRADLAKNAKARESAMSGAGLNPDGSDPYGRHQGAPRK